MTGLRWISVGPLLLLSLASLSCGSSRQLESIKINPAAATSQAQFTAIGTFSRPPSPVTLTSQEVTWCAGELTNVANPTAGMCVGNIAPFAIVDQNGLAKCGPVAQGTGYILAGIPTAPMNPDGGTPLKVYGSATLTCP